MRCLTKLISIYLSIYLSIYTYMSTYTYMYTCYIKIRGFWCFPKVASKPMVEASPFLHMLLWSRTRFRPHPRCVENSVENSARFTQTLQPRNQWQHAHIQEKLPKLEAAKTNQYYPQHGTTTDEPLTVSPLATPAIPGIPGLKKMSHGTMGEVGKLVS